MAPTMEEEVRLKEFNDVSIVDLDPAEKFLKAVISIPFAFKRVDAMLYISNFDTEVEYLKGSFETIKVYFFYHLLHHEIRPIYLLVGPLGLCFMGQTGKFKISIY